MSASSTDCITTHINNVHDLLKQGRTQQALNQLNALESSLDEHIEHIDYSEYELPA
ncbi:MAG: hypothetical protein ACRBCI_13495 [Cellvibrionaceae bacterium]